MARTAILLLLLAAGSLQQSSTPITPCPNVFKYEASGTEPGRWYGTIYLSTDSTLHSLWLNVVLDGKADILGNWVGDVSTSDNTDFKIENTNMKIHPGPAEEVRFFVQFNPLNKVPRLQAIRLNGREICNANNPQPALDRPEPDRPSRPETRPSRPETRPQRPQTERPGRPEVDIQTRPVGGKPAGAGPVYEQGSNSPGNANPYSIGGGSSSQTINTQTRPDDYRFTTAPPRRTTTTNKGYEIDDFDSVGKPDPSEYFGGGQPTIIVSNKPRPRPSQGQNRPDQQDSQSEECGKVFRNPNPLVVNGKPTLEGQWPWQIALYQTQTVDHKYICGGTLVDTEHIITAAHCVTLKGSNRVVNKNTLTVYLGKHNLRTSVEGVQIKLVSDITVHPQYNASSFGRDVAILTLRDPVRYTDWVRPACLWPDSEADISNIVGKKGSVVGWGFDDTGVATEELMLVEMPVVDQETCIRSYHEFFARFTSAYTYCAGYKDGTSVCNGDSGGGMVFNKQNTWHLRGLVSLSVARENEYRCDPTHYVVFTDLAKFLPWIREHIN